MTELGTEIQKHLHRLGWSQNRLAEEAGIGSGTISKIIRGVHDPAPTTLEAIANALGVDPIHLMRLAGLPFPVGPYDPKAAHIAQRLTDLPSGVRAKVVDILGAQLDTIDELIGQLQKVPVPETQTSQWENATFEEVASIGKSAMLGWARAHPDRFMEIITELGITPGSAINKAEPPHGTE